MRSRRLFIAWAAMALLLLGAAGQAAAAPLAHARPLTGTSPNPVSDAEKSIIQLGQVWTGFVQYTTDTGTAWSTKLESQSGCTAFFVTTTGHAVTAGHCVEEKFGREGLITTFLAGQVRDGLLTEAEAQALLPEALANWRVESEDGGSPPQLTVYAVQPHTVEGAVLERVVVAQVLDTRVYGQGDLALLKIEANNTPPLPIATVDPPNNSPLTAIGFPGATAAVVDESLQRADFKSGTVSSHQTLTTGVPVTAVNADVSPGMSGGPTVDQQGNVLGVNSFGVEGAAGFNFITDTTDLNDWLRGKGLQLASPRVPVADTPTQPIDPVRSTGTPSWVWIVAGIAGVALVAGIGLLVTMARRGKSQVAAPIPQYASVGSDPWAPPPASDPWGSPSGSNPWGGSGQQPTQQFGGPPPADGRRCPACATSVPANAQFCGSCGHRLG